MPAPSELLDRKRIRGRHIARATLSFRGAEVTKRILYDLGKNAIRGGFAALELEKGSEPRTVLTEMHRMACNHQDEPETLLRVAQRRATKLTTLASRESASRLCNEADDTIQPTYARTVAWQAVNQAGLKNVNLYTRRIKERWNKDWQASVRYARLQHIAPKAPAPNFMRGTSRFSRYSNSLLFQLRVGHAPLNGHLHKLKAAPTALCVACFDADETVDHFLFDCPAYDRQREALRAAAGEDWDTEGHLLGDETMAAHTVAFIHTTGRFAKERGEWVRDQGQGESAGDVRDAQPA
ncbi:unnamed protein product [Peniophora sp. CBMAI 1063]|nr:unnamed protein product [Peniophora sp. CBMAI 1063]